MWCFENPLLQRKAGGRRLSWKKTLVLGLCPVKKKEGDIFVATVGLLKLTKYTFTSGICIFYPSPEICRLKIDVIHWFSGFNQKFIYQWKPNRSVQQQKKIDPLRRKNSLFLA